MYSIRFTEQADADLLGIYIYTYNTWNEAQAIEYINGLKDAVNKLVDNPERSTVPEPSDILSSVWSVR